MNIFIGNPVTVPKNMFEELQETEASEEDMKITKSRWNQTSLCAYLNVYMSISSVENMLHRML